MHHTFAAEYQDVIGRCPASLQVPTGHVPQTTQRVSDISDVLWQKNDLR